MTTVLTHAPCAVAVVTSPVGDDRDRSPGAGLVVGVAEADADETAAAPGECSAGPRRSGADRSSVPAGRCRAPESGLTQVALYQT
ncbi:hypothetical protein ABB07_04450 [Streptomyces incarnatus]|uniref:Uncharacterized protein n=1 Tax=Streptomyces incarnatus TaxID=665007 RepID=A0ABM5TEG1_9ACTN|nr:hypothetical protein ABB07_04450 [Streptomyces incarnatus]